MWRVRIVAWTGNEYSSALPPCVPHLTAQNLRADISPHGTCTCSKFFSLAISDRVFGSGVKVGRYINCGGSSNWWCVLRMVAFLSMVVTVIP